MVNGKWLLDFIERLKASAWHQLYLPLLPFTHARSESINADSLKLQLLTARKKEWWQATADSLPQAVYLTTVKHTALVGIEPTTFRSWVQRATSCATETTVNVLKDTRVTSNPAPTHKDLPLWAVYTMKQFLRNFAISYCRIMNRNQLLSTAFQSTLNSSFVSYRMTADMLLFVDVVGVRLRREGRDMDTYIIVAII